MLDMDKKEPDKQKQLEEFWYNLYEPSGTKQWCAHRLAMLMWINEVELAEKLWHENKHQFYEESFMKTLFELVIVEGVGSGYAHPEFARLVQYRFFFHDRAFEASTTPLSELLQMNEPRFSSIDGAVDTKFDKSELQRIAEIVPQEFHDKLRLPLVLLRLSPAELPNTYEAVGSSLENLLLQRLLKLSSVHFGNYDRAPRVDKIKSLSMLARRKFKTIYTIFPESSSVYLTAAYEHPDLHR